MITPVADKIYLEPDFRLNPKTDIFCARCQKDIADASKTTHVTIDWDTWEVVSVGTGPDLIGRDCAKRIGLGG